MGKNTGTIHHCVGCEHRIGDISPGNCDVAPHRVGNQRLVFCKKHEMACRNGCRGWYHLKNQEGCLKCEGRWTAEANRAKAAEAKKKADAKHMADQSFWNPPKDRKRPS
ncbi:hypothetical protein BDU57DRAFT_582279 [Ampelomyces quisqualis]|uniref:Uncharacterized protein n=1 Tax=Ampelomyces quisqualis TaxID=50730 RepID=A0A6A5QA16_AMPQU|nr:hypothetical protein BDU57DRAFT_582279 [Ampelomyces quisqualis]